MEVDLTDDDMIITGPIPSSKVHVPPKKNSATPTPAMKPMSVSAVEIFDLSDDDDIIFEDDTANKDKNQSQNKMPPLSVQPPVVPTTSVSQEKDSASTDRMEVDDDIIEVLNDPCLVSSEKNDKSVFKKPATVLNESNNLSKTQMKSTATEKQKEDDVIEVMETSPQKPPDRNANNPNQKEATKSGLQDGVSRTDNNSKSSSNDTAKPDVLEPPQLSSRHLASKSSDTRYVVDISDDDGVKRKRKSENTCLNSSCKSGKYLKSAPMFVVSYYGCKLKKGKFDVCAECYRDVINHHEILTKRVYENKSLFAYENFPVNDITVVDLDSDEETSKPEEPLPFSVLKDVDDNLEEVLNACLSKCDLDFQVTEATNYLTNKLTSLELGGVEIDNLYKEYQVQIDKMRFDVYKLHNPIIKELPSLDLNPTSAEIFKSPFPAPPQPIKPEYSPRGVAMKKVTPISPNKAFPPRSEGSSQDIVALAQIKSNVSAQQLPPLGPLLRPKPRANDVVYVMKMSFFGVWLKGRVIEVVNSTQAGVPLIQTLYKVKMEVQGNRKQFSIKTVSGRHMAYPNPAQVRLPVGIRVIAIFQDDETSNQNKGGSYYSGLIAETPKSNNGYRYLVFFDDGYAQYVYHNKILVVCESSAKVWDDIHPDSSDFIRSYLQKYPERPMVKLAPNQVVKTEWNGKWWIARVVEVDGSLVKMSFDADKRTEWIYRGSTRLAPLYTELAQQQARQESGVGGTLSRMRGMGMRRINQPYVEYTQNIGMEDDLSEPQACVPSTAVRAVAKKSTSKKSEPHVSHSSSIRPGFFNPENIGVVKELQLPKDVPMPNRFQNHTCGPHCIAWIQYDPIRMRGYNPLSIPLYCGWQRELPKFKKKSTIMYTAPCGRRLRSMEELHKYLRICKSNMSVDLFDFDFWVNALSEYTLSERVKKYIVKEDMTNGKENVTIPLVNYVDHSLPSTLMYATQRQPYDDVNLNLDPNFLCGCDCTDDCQNKETCACWQLTVQGSSLYPGGVPDPNVGYYYKRLQERVITGIYECNEQCSCSKKTCLNRVVQHPLQLQLQLFKTPNKGWGLRCINDIPKGTFICIYAGYLYTEQTANKIGEEEGDDYLAELDYIEVVERMKEDYESDVEDDDAEDEQPPPKSGNHGNEDRQRSSRNRSRDETDNEYKARSSSDSYTDGTIRSRLRKRSAADFDATDGEKGYKKRDSQRGDLDGNDEGSDDDKMAFLERLPSSFTPKPLRKPQSVVQPQVHRFQSVRKFYGPNERVYIMDANKVGNIGRYLNHSCNPNVFVQNVFVDTHDLRFPWVAFFALTYIKAGSELTWDYNYNVGSVPDKQIICQCGSLECRGRLL